MIYIAHLYYDLMNLYGESGNIKALEHSLKIQKVKYKVDKLTINDKIDFNKYDLIYIGCGTEENELIVLKDILKYKNKIKKYIEDDKFILATGNSLELFGKSIGDNEALNIFSYETKYLDKRVVGDYINKIALLNDEIIAFQNRGSKIVYNLNPLFDNEVGVVYKNFYGTYLLGPILVRNPEFNKYISNKLIKTKNDKFRFKKYNYKLDKEAHDSYLKTYYKSDVKEIK